MEILIDRSPYWLKSAYVAAAQSIKYGLNVCGLLEKLDQKAKTDPNYHYWRSLLAIHQLEDMIALDIPWWTYTAIAEIESYIKRQNHPLSVFEYGSGASTVWLAKRAQHVLSIEHDKRWYQQLQPKLQDCATQIILQLREPEYGVLNANYQSVKQRSADFKNYVMAIQEQPHMYDLIIIDGRCRSACLNQAIPYLKPTGIIVFDNSNRARYQEALLKSPLQIQRFAGKVPGSPLNSETALLAF